MINVHHLHHKKKKKFEEGGRRRRRIHIYSLNSLNSSERKHWLILPT
jgi:hypothetical protein